MSPDPAGSDENQLANDIAAKYTGIVTSWLRKTISQNVVSLIDKEQLRSEILFDLIQQLRQVAPRVCEPNEVVSICKTITDHRALDAIKCARRLKRIRETEGNANPSVVELQDRSSSSRPDLVMETNETIAVVLDSLDENHRKVFELKRLGWTTKQIANKLDVSIRTIQVRLTTIRGVLNRVREKENPTSNLQPPTSNLQPPTSNNQQPTTNNRRPTTEGQVHLTLCKIK